MQTAVGNTTGYVNYVYNLQAKGTAQVTSQILGMSGLVGSTLGQLAFQTSAYLSDAESVAMSFGMVATAGLYKATKQAMEFDYAMQGVQAIAGQNNIGDLGDQAMAMSNKFGVAVDQMVEGLESLARAGVSPDNMKGILEQAMGLSKLEAIDLNTAINSLISTTNLLDTKGLDLESPEYVEALKYQNQKITATSEAAPINAQDIIHTLEHVGGYASAANIDQDDLYAVIAQLGSKGTKSEIAGTSLRAFLAAGQKDTAQRALKRIGLEVSDLWKNDDTMMSISDMKDVLDEAMEAKGYTKQEKLEFYSDFAGYKQANQIMKIDTTSVREFKDKIDKSWDTGKKVNTILQTTQNHLQSILQMGTNIVTHVGQPLMQVANIILSPLQTLMGAVDFIITKVPGMKWAAAGTLLMVAVKGISTVFNKIAPSLGLMVLNFSDISSYAKNTRDALFESANILTTIMSGNRSNIVNLEKEKILSNIDTEDKIQYFVKYKDFDKKNFSKKHLEDIINLKIKDMNPEDVRKMEQQIVADKTKRYNEKGQLYTEDKKTTAEIQEERNEILSNLGADIIGLRNAFENFTNQQKGPEKKANSDGPDKLDKISNNIESFKKTTIDHITVSTAAIYSNTEQVTKKIDNVKEDTKKIVSLLTEMKKGFTINGVNGETVQANLDFDYSHIDTIDTTLKEGFKEIVDTLKECCSIKQKSKKKDKKEKDVVSPTVVVEIDDSSKKSKKEGENKVPPKIEVKVEPPHLAGNTDDTISLDGFVQETVKKNQANARRTQSNKPKHVKLPKYTGLKLNEIANLRSSDRGKEVKKVEMWLKKVIKDAELFKNEFEDEAEYLDFVAEQYYEAFSLIDAYDLTSLLETNVLEKKHLQGFKKTYTKMQDTIRKSKKFNVADARNIFTSGKRYADIRTGGQEGARSYYQNYEVGTTSRDLGTINKLEYDANNFERTIASGGNKRQKRVMDINYSNEARSVGSFTYTNSTGRQSTYEAMDVLPEQMIISVSEGVTDTVYNLVQGIADRLVYLQQKGGKTRLPITQAGGVKTIQDIEREIDHLQDVLELKTIKMADILDKTGTEEVFSNKYGDVISHLSPAFIQLFNRQLLDAKGDVLKEVSFIDSNAQKQTISTVMAGTVTDSKGNVRKKTAEEIRSQFQSLLTIQEYNDAAIDQLNDFLNNSTIKYALELGEIFDDSEILSMIKNRPDLSNNLIGKDLLSTLFLFYKGGERELAKLDHALQREEMNRGGMGATKFIADINEEVYDYAMDEEVIQNRYADRDPNMDLSMTMDTGALAFKDDLINPDSDAINIPITKVFVDNMTGALSDALQATPNKTLANLEKIKADYGIEVLSILEQIAELDRQHKMITEIDEIIKHGQIPLDNVVVKDGEIDWSTVTVDTVRQIYRGLLVKAKHHKDITPGLVEGKRQVFGELNNPESYLRDTILAGQAVESSYNNTVDYIKSYEDMKVNDPNDDTDYTPNVVKKRSLTSVVRSSHTPDIVSASKATPGTGGEEEGFRYYYIKTKDGYMRYVDQAEMMSEIPGGKVKSKKLKPPEQNQAKLTNKFVGNLALEYVKLDNQMDKLEEKLEKNEIDFYEYLETVDDILTKQVNIRNNVLSNSLDALDLFNVDDLAYAIDLGVGKGREVIPGLFVRTSGAFAEMHNGDPFERDKNGKILGIKHDYHNRFSEIVTPELEKKRFSERLKSKNKLNAAFLTGFGFSQNDIGGDNWSIPLSQRIIDSIEAQYNNQKFSGVDLERYKTDKDYKREIDDMYERMRVMNYTTPGKKEGTLDRNLFTKTVNRQEFEELMRNNMLLPQDIAAHTDGKGNILGGQKGKYEIFDLSLLEYNKEDLYNATVMGLLAEDIMLQESIALYDTFTDMAGNKYINKDLTTGDIFKWSENVKGKGRTRVLSHGVSSFLGDVMAKSGVFNGMGDKEEQISSGFDLLYFLNEGDNKTRFMANMINNPKLLASIATESVKRGAGILEKQQQLTEIIKQYEETGIFDSEEAEEMYNNRKRLMNVYETELALENELQDIFSHINDLALIRSEYNNNPKYLQQLEKEGLLEGNIEDYDNLEDYIHQKVLRNEENIKKQTTAQNEEEKRKEKIDKKISDAIWQPFDELFLSFDKESKTTGTVFFNKKYFKDFSSVDNFKDFVLTEKMHYGRQQNEENPEQAIKEFFNQRQGQIKNYLIQMFKVTGGLKGLKMAYPEKTVEKWVDSFMEEHDEWETMYFIYEYLANQQQQYDTGDVVPKTLEYITRTEEKQKRVKELIKNLDTQEKRQVLREGIDPKAINVLLGKGKSINDLKTIKDFNDLIDLYDESQLDNIIKNFEEGKYKREQKTNIMDELDSRELYKNARSLPSVGFIYQYGYWGKGEDDQEEGDVTKSKYKTHGGKYRKDDLRVNSRKDIFEEERNAIRDYRYQYLSLIDEVKKLEFLLDHSDASERGGIAEKLSIAKSELSTIEQDLELLENLNKISSQSSRTKRDDPIYDELDEKARTIADFRDKFFSVEYAIESGGLMEKEKIGGSVFTHEFGIKPTADILSEVEELEKRWYELRELGSQGNSKHFVKKSLKPGGLDKEYDRIEKRLKELKKPALEKIEKESKNRFNEILKEYFGVTEIDEEGKIYSTDLWTSYVNEAATKTRLNHQGLEYNDPNKFYATVQTYAQKAFMDNTIAGLKELEKIIPFLKGSPELILSNIPRENIAFDFSILSEKEFENAKQRKVPLSYDTYDEYLANVMTGFKGDRSVARILGDTANKTENEKKAQEEAVAQEEEIKERIKNSSIPQEVLDNSKKVNDFMKNRQETIENIVNENETIFQTRQREAKERIKKSDEYNTLTEWLENVKNNFYQTFSNAAEKVFGKFSDDGFQQSSLFSGLDYNLQANKLENASNALHKNINSLVLWRDALLQVGGDSKLLQIPLDAIALGLTSIIMGTETISKVTDTLLSIVKHAQELKEFHMTEILNFPISAESGVGKMIGGLGGLIEPGIEKIDVLLTKYILPLVPYITAIGIGLYGVKKALDLSYESHKKYLKELEEETKENRSRARSLKVTTEQSKKANDEYKYALNKTKLENANLSRMTGAIKLTEANNDMLWGKYGIASALDKIQGKYESTAAEYDGTSGQIRRIKEHTTGGQGLIRGLPGYYSQAEEMVAAYYDANKLAIGVMDEYKDELGELYDAETNAMRKHPDENARETREFQIALDKFVEATGITREHAQQYLDYMQTEHNVDNAIQAMQAQADKIMATTDMQIQAIGFGANPSDVLGLNGIEAQQNAMVQAQADMIKLETSSQLWWKAVWSTITSPLRAIISPIFAIAHTLAAIWAIITGNWNSANLHMQQAGSSLNVLGETATYWGAWGNVEATDFNAIGQGAIDENDRANYGNAQSASSGSGPRVPIPKENSIFGFLPVWWPNKPGKGGAHGAKEHEETLAQNAQQSFFGKLIGGITSTLGFILGAVSLIAAGKGMEMLWNSGIGRKIADGLSKHLPNIKNKLDNFVKNHESVQKVIGYGKTVGKIFGLDKAKNFIGQYIPQDWKDSWHSFWNKEDSDITKEDIEEDKSIEENISSVTEYVRDIYTLLSRKDKTKGEKVYLETTPGAMNISESILDIDEEESVQDKLRHFLTNIGESSISRGERAAQYDAIYGAYDGTNFMRELTPLDPWEDASPLGKMVKAYNEFTHGGAFSNSVFSGDVAETDLYQGNVTYGDLTNALIKYINQSEGLWEDSILYHGGGLLRTDEGSNIGSIHKIMSTSFSEEIADKFKKDKYMTKIYAPQGTKGLYTDSMGEDEFTLDEGTRFVQLSRDDKNKTAEVLLLTPTLMNDLGLTEEMIDQAIGQGLNMKNLLGIENNPKDNFNTIGHEKYYERLYANKKFTEDEWIDYIIDNQTISDDDDSTWTNIWSLGSQPWNDVIRGTLSPNIKLDDFFTNEDYWPLAEFGDGQESAKYYKDILNLKDDATIGEVANILLDVMSRANEIGEDTVAYRAGYLNTKEGEMGKLSGITSTTLKESEMDNYDYDENAYRMKMLIPKEAKGLYNPQSFEFTLPPGMDYKVLERDDENKTATILLMPPTQQQEQENKNIDVPTLPITSLMPVDTKKSWSGYLSEKIHNFTDPWQNYATQKKNSLLGISDEDKETFSKKKRKGMNKEEREYLNEKYNLGLDLDDFRTSKQANKAVRDKLDENEQWDTAMNDLHGGGLRRHQIKSTIKNNYVEPWKEYGKNKASQWMTEAELYNQNPTYMGKQIYDRENASMPVKILGKGMEIKDKWAAKIGLGSTGSLGELREAIHDPEKMEQYLKDRLDSFDSESTIGQYRDKAYKAKEIISDPEKTMQWVQGKYYDGLDKGQEEYEWYQGGELNYKDLSIPNKIRHMKESVLGMSGDESFADLLQDPERTMEVARRGYDALQEGGLNGLLGADEDYDIAGPVKDKVSELFGKIREGAEEGIDEEDDGNGGAGGLIQKAKEKLAGFFDRDKSPITKEEIEEKEKSGDFETISDWKKKKLEDIQKPSLFSRIKNRLGFGGESAEEEAGSLSDWKTKKTAEIQEEKGGESLSNRLTNKIKNVFGSKEGPVSNIGKMLNMDVEGQHALAESGLLNGKMSPGIGQAFSESTAGAMEEDASILDLNDTGEVLSGRNIKKGSKALSNIGSKLSNKGGKMGKVGNVLSKVGGGASKLGEKGIGGVAKGGLSKLGKTGVGKAVSGIGKKAIGGIGKKLATKGIAQVGSKVLGGALMATGIGAPLGLLLESPIGGALIEGAMDLGGKALGAVGGAIGGAAKGIGNFLGIGRRPIGGRGKGGMLGAIGGLGALSPVGMLAGAAGGLLGSVFGGGGPGNMGKMGGNILQKMAVPLGGMMGVLGKMFTNDKQTKGINEKIEAHAGKTLEAVREQNSKSNPNSNTSGGSITIQNININTADDPEAIKAMFLELIIELQEQVNPRVVSRTSGKAPESSSTSTSPTDSTNQQNNNENQNSNSNSNSDKTNGNVT